MLTGLVVLFQPSDNCNVDWFGGAVPAFRQMLTGWVVVFQPSDNCNADWFGGAVPAFR